MGIGDNVMASGLAKGAVSRGVRVAFGDGRKILWDGNSAMVFKNNPNVALPGQERDWDLEWVPFYKGHRIYNQQDAENQRWIWNYEFQAKSGEFFFSSDEENWLAEAGVPEGAVVIEPHVPWSKTVAPNKDWGFVKYDLVADHFARLGRPVVQFQPPIGPALKKAWIVETPVFRLAALVLSKASLYVGPEGGLHHAAAAVGKPAVVLFGGFVPPQITGYSTHANLTGGAEACGRYTPCQHCREAMDRISIDEVISRAEKFLG